MNNAEEQIAHRTPEPKEKQPASKDPPMHQVVHTQAAARSRRKTRDRPAKARMRGFHFRVQPSEKAFWIRCSSRCEKRGGLYISWAWISAPVKSQGGDKCSNSQREI